MEKSMSCCVISRQCACMSYTKAAGGKLYNPRNVGGNGYGTGNEVIVPILIGEFQGGN